MNVILLLVGLLSSMNCLKIDSAKGRPSAPAKSDDEAFARGKEAFDKGEFERAFKEFDAAIRQDPSMGVAFHYRAACWRIQGQWQKALKDHDEAIRLLTPISVHPVGRYVVSEVYLGRAETWYAAGQWDKVIADCDEAIRLAPAVLGPTTAYADRAAAWQQKGDFARALKDMDEMVRLDPRNPDWLDRRGMILAASGDHAKAFQEYNKALDINSAYAPVLFHRGISWAALREWEKALKDYTDALRQSSGVTAALIRQDRGTAWAALGKRQEALTDYTESLRVFPDHPETLTRRGLVFFAEGEVEKAMADFDRAIKADPKPIQGFYCRASTWIQLKQWDKAVADLTEVLRLDSRNVNALCNRGLIRKWSGDWAGAIEDFEALVCVAPTCAQGYANLAKIRGACPDAKYRDGDKAVADGKRACELTRWKEPKYVACLALAYAESGDFEEAIKWQTQVVDDPAIARNELDEAEAKMRLLDFKWKHPVRIGPEIAPLKNH
jgi:tetratricopeptide (TPR) repeat protein